MEEFSMGIFRPNITVSDVVNICIKTYFGLQHNRKPLPEEIKGIIITGSYAEVWKF